MEKNIKSYDSNYESTGVKSNIIYKKNVSTFALTFTIKKNVF